MTLWVKVCGLSDARAVDAALEAGVDAIGFVFAPSPREISIGAACELQRHIGGAAATVAVMRHPLKEVAERILQELEPDYLQADVSDLQTINVPHGVRTLPVLRAGTIAGDATLPSRALFEGAHSGVGELADWDEAHALARRLQLILAGGLAPDNVAAAILRVQPFGVDVSSGVEAHPGSKDGQKITQFVRAARAAAAQLEQNEDRVW